jgi:hypothetical protein
MFRLAYRVRCTALTVSSLPRVREWQLGARRGDAGGCVGAGIVVGVVGAGIVVMVGVVGLGFG